ncbi:MAG: single-stranded-DNA-specific exonuclease RecJ [Gammaproteobacteria bacterium]
MQIIRRPDAGTDHLPENLHPLLKRLYASRAVAAPGELDYSLKALLPHTALSNIDHAAVLLADALAAGKRILIVADFDADGATACALAVRGLTALGAKDVRYIVPNRFDYGYGLSPEIVAVAAEQNPDVIVTVDNGIASVAGVAAAKQHGMQVVVTDHHLPGHELPAADAIVNPNLRDDPFPSKCLAGVGVMFYVLIALRAVLRERDWFNAQSISEPNLAQWLDLVALGTVADMVPLDHNNRILVAQGLARIRSQACCPGINALLKLSGRQPAGITASDLGFAVAPRLNAAGRLTDMTVGIECLLTDSAEAATAMARQLDQLNHERREIQATMHEDADQILRDLALAEGADAMGVCLYRDDWHQGLVGLVAGRVKDELHRPVIAFAPAGDGINLKGSARSIPGVHIRDALDAVATQNPGLIAKFGGHAMAAGLSLDAACLEPFAEAFDMEVRRQLNGDDPVGRIISDGPLPAGSLSMQVAKLIAEAGPWGQGFPEPVFDGEFELLERKIVGGRHLRLQLKAPDSQKPVNAIAFSTVDHDWPEQVQRVSVAYRLDINHFAGRRELQLMVDWVKPL